jgi:8-oxo-dGTP pyrophosphatase MutT (NUDIX family)
MNKVVDYAVLADSGESAREVFAELRHVEVQPIMSDGARSDAQKLLVLMRKGIDAVAVLPYARAAGEILIALRAGQRAAVWLRRAMPLAVPEPDAPALLWECVAGVREWSDLGAAGLRDRARIELEEEIGITIAVDRLQPLGPATFPSPGMFPERIFFFSVELSETELRGAHAQGDGSSAEAGAEVRIYSLPEALADCRNGVIVDQKTELMLRRLAETHP